MRKCESCFRYCENWRDAEAKGMKPVYYYGFAEFFHKPRPGVKLHALGINCPSGDVLSPNHPACKSHKYRWLQNLEVWWQWHFKQGVEAWYRKSIRIPIGSLLKPVPLAWKDSFDGIADRIIPNGEPVCPRCGEMPYSYERCKFCGQKFLPDEFGQDKTVPQREMREEEPIVFMDGICPECGYSCGNGGYGPLRCRCGWVGKEAEMSGEMKRDIDDLFAEDGGRV